MAECYFIPNEICAICGHDGWGWYCTFDHKFDGYLVLTGLS